MCQFNKKIADAITTAKEKTDSKRIPHTVILQGKDVLIVPYEFAKYFPESAKIHRASLYWN